MNFMHNHKQNFMHNQVNIYAQSPDLWQLSSLDLLCTIYFRKQRSNPLSIFSQFFPQYRHGLSRIHLLPSAAEI